MRQQGISELLGERIDQCLAWPLPADETCASTARRLFRAAVGRLCLAEDIRDDAVLMASELAANTLHAREASGEAGLAQVPRCPELWLYLRGVGMHRQLVCKVFDSFRGWLHGPPPVTGPDASAVRHRTGCHGAVWYGEDGAGEVSGRGLRIVGELSRGCWGHHLTRSRLNGWSVRGKVVWFAVPAPLAHVRLADVTGLFACTRSADVTASRRREQISARQAAAELSRMLDERGLAVTVTHRQQPDASTSVLMVRRGLTLWCRPGGVSLTGPAGCGEWWSYTDLVEAAEQAIRRHEELAPDRHAYRVSVTA